MNYLILLCGGKSTRFNNEVPKQFVTINNKYVFEYSLLAFYKSKKIDFVIIPAEPIYFLLISEVLEKYNMKFLLAKPGETRQESVYNSLSLIKSVNKDDIVIIHDAARPLLTVSLINSIVDSVNEFGSAVPYHYSVNATYSTLTTNYIDKNTILEIETPQAFNLNKLILAHKKAQNNNIFNSCDDGILFNKFINKINLIENKELNIKITYGKDLDIVKGLLSNEC